MTVEYCVHAPASRYQYQKMSALSALVEHRGRSIINNYQSIHSISSHFMTLSAHGASRQGWRTGSTNGSPLGRPFPSFPVLCFEYAAPNDPSSSQWPVPCEQSSRPAKSSMWPAHFEMYSDIPEVQQLHIFQSAKLLLSWWLQNWPKPRQPPVKKWGERGQSTKHDEDWWRDMGCPSSRPMKMMWKAKYFGVFKLINMLTMCKICALV